MLKFSSFEGYIDKFNEQDEETVIQHVPNSSAKEWLAENIPLFECPDKELEQVYYFRWWVFRKHIKQTPDGYIITEFLPAVPWAGKHNSIVCPAGHHIYEGRWLHDGRYVEDYIRFWYRKGGAPRAYSNWLGDAVWQYCTVKGDYSLAAELLDDMVQDYREWEHTNLHESGLFWSSDDRDGMEYSISGSGLRPTLNCYLFSYAETISKTAALSGKIGVADEFQCKAENLRQLVNDRLWDEKAQFYKGIPLADRDTPVSSWSFDRADPERNAREEMGYHPWYFGLAETGREAAWEQVLLEDGFSAPYGPATAEQRHPRFMYNADHECLWNGPSWPFATSMTLTALANLLNSTPQKVIGKTDYVDLLSRYAGSHRRTRADGKDVRWLDENLDPYGGDWMARKQLEKWGWRPEKGGKERGKDYNHSTFCDLVLTGLIGLRPHVNDTIVIHPLITEGVWDYFCVDSICYHGKKLTILYDRDGGHYNLGKGLRVYVK